MVSLQQWKEKLLDILDDTFYRKSEIDEKENVLNESINEKLDIDDAFSGDYNDLINKPDSFPISIIENEEDIDNDGIYVLNKPPLIITYTSRYTNQNFALSEEWGDYNGDIIIDWGDGKATIINDKTKYPVLYYNRDYEYMIIKIYGDIISLNKIFKQNYGIINLTIPSSIKNFQNNTFDIEIIDYDNNENITAKTIGLYWEGYDIVEYDIFSELDFTPTFIIPYGATQSYIDKGYPEQYLQERDE